MDTVVQTVANDLVSRLVSRLQDGCRERANAGETLRRLHQALLKIQASIEEAEGRHITNHHMLRQLKMFTETVAQGYYWLDTLVTTHTHEEDGMQEQEDAKYFYSWSSFNPSKRICRISTSVKALLFGHKDMTKLKQIMAMVETVAADVRDFNVLLVGYPRLCRRPYDTYLYVEKCMFGRHMEREQIINFLLETADDDQNLGVLPIIGRRSSGKKTLVENVCSDGRVRDHFFSISFLDGDDLESEMMDFYSREGALITNHSFQVKRYLFVIEFVFSVDEEAWAKFYRRGCGLMRQTGSKILVVSTKQLGRGCTIGHNTPHNSQVSCP